MGGQLKPCCADPANRTEPKPVDGREELTVQVCIVCGCRHFELVAEPGVLGVKGGTL